MTKMQKPLIWVTDESETPKTRKGGENKKILLSPYHSKRGCYNANHSNVSKDHSQFSQQHHNDLSKHCCTCHHDFYFTCAETGQKRTKNYYNQQYGKNNNQKISPYGHPDVLCNSEFYSDHRGQQFHCNHDRTFSSSSSSTVNKTSSEPISRFVRPSERSNNQDIYVVGISRSINAKNKRKCQKHDKTMIQQQQQSMLFPKKNLRFSSKNNSIQLRRVNKEGRKERGRLDFFKSLAIVDEGTDGYQQQSQITKKCCQHNSITCHCSLCIRRKFQCECQTCFISLRNDSSRVKGSKFTNNLLALKRLKHYASEYDADITSAVETLPVNAHQMMDDWIGMNQSLCLPLKKVMSDQNKPDDDDGVTELQLKHPLLVVSSTKPLVYYKAEVRSEDSGKNTSTETFAKDVILSGSSSEIPLSPHECHYRTRRRRTRTERHFQKRRCCRKIDGGKKNLDISTNIVHVNITPQPEKKDETSCPTFHDPLCPDDSVDNVLSNTNTNDDKLRQAARNILDTVLSQVDVDEKIHDSIIVNTPKRFSKMISEMTDGYHLDPNEVVEKAIFCYNGPTLEPEIVIRDLPVSSLCEHHLLPFHGTCSIAYIPDGRILGLSKFSRIVDVFAHRLQLQERLTEQISVFLNKSLIPRALAITITAVHGCMALRGVRATSSSTTTRNFLVKERIYRHS